MFAILIIFGTVFINSVYIFYINWSYKANALADSLQHPQFRYELLHLQIHTLYDYTWVPLEPETNGFNNQTSLNVISMANTLAFGYLVKKTLCVR